MSYSKGHPSLNQWKYKSETFLLYLDIYLIIFIFIFILASLICSTFSNILFLIDNTAS
jgi:hypothetical protein